MPCPSPGEWPWPPGSARPWPPSGANCPGPGPSWPPPATALAVGLADDLRPLPAWAKLAGQAGAGVVLAALGVRAALPGPEVVAWAATIAWVVVAANALNLFDNFDGAAGGAALVAGLALSLWWGLGGGPTALGAALAGAAAGFLVWNAPPARIFMGDAGSHFLGAALAGLTLLDAGRAGTAGAAPAALAILVPVVLLAVPLFDTALVAVERRRHHRPLSVGGAGPHLPPPGSPGPAGSPGGADPLGPVGGGGRCGLAGCCGPVVVRRRGGGAGRWRWPCWGCASARVPVYD